MQLFKQMSPQEHEMFYPETKQAWRKWLQENHESQQSVWLICYKMKAGKPTLSWSDAVDEALCFGWIDSTRKSLDEEKFMQFFGKRKPGSTWSKVNKEKVQKLIEEGHMTPAGLKCIEVAKQNGSWTILDDVEELTIPTALEAAFKKHKGSKNLFLSLSKSARKMMLHRIAMAKQDDTKQKRIKEIIDTLAAQKPTTK